MADAISRIIQRWRRLFRRKQPMPWERRQSAELLYMVSKDAWACQMVADLLELSGDPGESMADYVSQMLREPHRQVIENDNRRELARIDQGFSHDHR